MYIVIAKSEMARRSKMADPVGVIIITAVGIIAVLAFVASI